jgi:hypothetical protein
MMTNIPECLAAYADDRRWVGWREERRDGKATKMPFSSVTGRAASSIDPSTWATLDEALSYAERAGMTGVGIMLGGGLGGVDLDACRDPDTGAIKAWAQKVVDAFSSYTEISPSGTGLKVFALGAPAELPASTIPIDAPSTNGKRPAIEAYVSGRYFTITGRIVADAPDELRDCGEVGGAWDRMVRLLQARATTNGNGTRAAGAATGSTEIPDALKRVLDGDGKAGMLWRLGKDGGGDRSRNDAALATVLGALGFEDGPVEAALRSYPLGQIGQGAITGRDADRQIGRLLGIAREARERREEDATTRGVTLEDFYAYMPQHSYIFVPSREMWPASSVNARIPPVPLLASDGSPAVDDKGKPRTLPAHTWIDQNRPVEMMTWVPGSPMLIEDRLIAHGGWIERPGCRTFNLYRPPTIKRGDPSKADPYIEHVHRIFPSEAEHILRWLAHRVQRPQEKINHALVLQGGQGTGKDTIIEGAIPAVGAWNVAEVSPDQLLGRFNGFVKSVILRISEARDLGDTDRYRLYDHLKTLVAAPPDVLRCDEKHLREHAVPNVTGVVITSNYIDGIFLPADDRRHFVAWTELTKEDFSEDYWNRLYAWYAAGGYEHVAAYLAALDLSGFNSKAPPPKTDAFWAVVDAGRAPEDAELADALDRLGNPDAATLSMIADRAESAFGEWLRDRKNSRNIPHRMEAVEYMPVRNDGAKDGKWKVGGRRQVIYARRQLSTRDRLAAARRLAEADR